MNGASIVMVLVLLVALAAGMVFLVDQLNRSAEEIMAAQATILDLQGSLEQAQLNAGRQQQQIDELAASLSQKSADLDQSQATVIALQKSIADLNAVVSQQSVGLDQLRQALQNEQSARTGAEQQSAVLVEQAHQLRTTISGLESRLAALSLQQGAAKEHQVLQSSVSPLVPVTGAAMGGASGLPLAVPAVGLVLAGGAIAWGRHGRNVHRANRVAVWMTPDQAHSYARLQSNNASKPLNREL